MNIFYILEWLSFALKEVSVNQFVKDNTLHYQNLHKRHNIELLTYSPILSHMHETSYYNCYQCTAKVRDYRM